MLCMGIKTQRAAASCIEERGSSPDVRIIMQSRRMKYTLSTYLGLQTPG
jgi:hypothetical protein